MEYKTIIFILGILIILIILGIYFLNLRDAKKTLKIIAMPILLASILILISVLSNFNFVWIAQGQASGRRIKKVGNRVSITHCYM